MLRRNVFCLRWSTRWFTSNSRLRPRSSSSFHKRIRCFSMLKKSFLTDLSLDLDINAIKEERKSKKISVHQLMNEKLEQKCTEVISQFSNEETRTLKIIKLEHSFLYAEGYAFIAPEMMTNKLWIEALTLPSKEDRMQYYYYLQQKANLRAIENNQRKENPEPLGDQETDTSYILYNKMKLARTGNHALSSAMTHSIPLVFDMGFEDWMGAKEFAYVAKQLWEAYAVNRAHSDPFHFIFTSCEKKRILYRTLELRYLLNCDHFLVSETEKSYIDLFDRSQLVYLSAHAKSTVTTFDPSRVYIIGAYNDPRSSLQFGPGKAKEQGIDCQKLPLDFHLQWVMGSKDFTLPSVVQILLDVNKNKGDWKKAFANTIPSKNYKGFRNGMT